MSEQHQGMNAHTSQVVKHFCHSAKRNCDLTGKMSEVKVLTKHFMKVTRNSDCFQHNKTTGYIAILDSNYWTLMDKLIAWSYVKHDYSSSQHKQIQNGDYWTCFLAHFPIKKLLTMYSYLAINLTCNQFGNQFKHWWKPGDLDIFRKKCSMQ